MMQHTFIYYIKITLSKERETDRWRMSADGFSTLLRTLSQKAEQKPSSLFRTYTEHHPKHRPNGLIHPPTHTHTHTHTHTLTHSHAHTHARSLAHTLNTELINI